MDRSQKEDLVQSLKASLSDAAVVIVTQQVGLTVSEVTDLRRNAREVGASYKVVKNNLARLAVEGTKFEGLSQYLSGPTALAFSQDPVAAAKAVVKYADSNEKVKVIGGIMGGNVLSSAAVNALAKLPSLDVLRSQLIGLLSMPATNIARILVEPGSRVARVLNARA
jgi:large subunit ribosomal protein L10